MKWFGGKKNRLTSKRKRLESCEESVKKKSVNLEPRELMCQMCLGERECRGEVGLQILSSHCTKMLLQLPHGFVFQPQSTPLNKHINSKEKKIPPPTESKKTPGGVALQ